MVAEVAATIGIGNANFVNSSACDWGSAGSGVAITIAAVIIHGANLPNVRTGVSNGTKKLGKS